MSEMAEETQETTATVEEQQAETQTTTTATTIDPAEFARVQAALKAANKEAADRRKKLEAYEQAEAAKKEAEMTAAQKAEARAEAAEKAAEAARLELQTERIKGAFHAEANKAQFGDDGKKKFIDPDAAMKLADQSTATVEDGRVTGVTDALKALAKQYPWMLDGSGATQSASASPAKGQKPNSTNQAQVSKYPRATY